VEGPLVQSRGATPEFLSVGVAIVFRTASGTKPREQQLEEQ